MAATGAPAARSGEMPEGSGQMVSVGAAMYSARAPPAAKSVGYNQRCLTYILCPREYVLGLVLAAT